MTTSQLRTGENSSPFLNASRESPDDKALKALADEQQRISSVSEK